MSLRRYLSGFAVLVGLAMAMPASATPLSPLAAPAVQDLVSRVQWVCDANRCIDPRSGAYTESNCNRRGCWPSSGIRGYTNPGGGGGYGNSYDGGPGYARPRYRGEGYGGGYGGGGGRFDCNRNRCIDTATGRVWESTCNRNGCRPLRPARQQRGYGGGWDY